MAGSSKTRKPHACEIELHTIPVLTSTKQMLKAKKSIMRSSKISSGDAIRS